MSEEIKEIKQSINKVQMNGVLSEMNLKETVKEVVLKQNKDDKGTKVTCKVIEKAEFKNPTFTVEVNGNTIGVEYFGINFGINEKKLDENGNVVDNDKFKSIQTILNKYNPKIGGRADEEPTRVKVDGKLSLNEYGSVARNSDGEFISTTQITAFGVSSSNVSEDDSADAEISGVISNITHEVKNDEETGRLIVNFVSFGYNGVAEPYKFIVENDLASDFESYYEVGTRAKISYEIITKQVGNARPQSSGGFGRRDAKITSGYKVTEYSIFRGDEPYDEESEYWIDDNSIREKMEEREVYIANKIKDAVDKAKNGGNTTTTTKPSPKGASGGANPFGTPKANPFGNATTKKANPFA